MSRHLRRRVATRRRMSRRICSRRRMSRRICSRLRMSRRLCSSSRICWRRRISRFVPHRQRHWHLHSRLVWVVRGDGQCVSVSARRQASGVYGDFDRLRAAWRDGAGSR